MLTIYFEDTPRLWAVHFDPEGPIWRGRTKLEAVEEMLCDDHSDTMARVAEEVLELVGIAEEAEATTKRYAAYISPEEHAIALSNAQKERDQYRARLGAMFPLFQEARDALPAIPMASAKLRGLDLSLAQRMDAVGVPEEWAKHPENPETPK